MNSYKTRRYTPMAYIWRCELRRSHLPHTRGTRSGKDPKVSLDDHGEAVAVAVAVEVFSGGLSLSGGLPRGLAVVVSWGLVVVGSGLLARMLFFSTLFSTVTLGGPLGALCSPSWLPPMSPAIRNPIRNPMSAHTAALRTSHLLHRRMFS